MEKSDLLIEIGTEEIPSRFIPSAIQFLSTKFTDGLKKEKLNYGKIKSFSTPRRLAIKVDSIPIKQEDTKVERIGPTEQIAYNNGKLTKAGLGFLQSCNADESDIFFVETKKGRKIGIKKDILGKKTSTIIQETLKKILASFSFPKSMRWENPSFQFARPIRWILIWWEDSLLSFEFEGISSNNLTCGNRIFGLNKSIQITSIDDYEKKLKKNGVIPNRTERKKKIEQELLSFYKDSDYQVIENKKLIETVTDLVESPSVVEGSFSDSFLILPDQVITNTLSEHQKYFAVKNTKTVQLTNRFLFVSNGDPDYSNVIRLGNEKVITARLNDAQFFYEEDTKVPLKSHVEKLKNVLFAADLGTLYDKTLRLQSICKILFGLIKNYEFCDTKQKSILRAAYLSKADLATLMLNEKEFTKLQGYIGMKYAQKSSEKKEIAQAIYEHYLPRGFKDILPSSVEGAIVAIADKMDTICAIIGSGSLPTGSNDPFALRRAASGIVQIIYDQNFELDLDDLIKTTYQEIETNLNRKVENINFVYSYFKQRIIWFMQQQDIHYDVIESVTHIDFYNVADALARANDLQKFKQRADFKKLVIGFKRVSNIIEKEKNVPDLQSGLLVENAEQDLYKGVMTLQKSISQLLLSKSYHQLLEELVHFSPKIDLFFDQVLVNVDEEEIRLNRYSLLLKIRNIFLKVADLAKIVIE